MGPSEGALDTQHNHNGRVLLWASPSRRVQMGGTHHLTSGLCTLHRPQLLLRCRAWAFTPSKQPHAPLDKQLVTRR